MIIGKIGNGKTTFLLGLLNELTTDKSSSLSKILINGTVAYVA